MATVNKTFRLHEDVVEILDRLVGEGKAPSQTALIEDLLRRADQWHQQERREEELEAEYARAWADREYRAEQEQIEGEFWPLDVEAWRLAEQPTDSAGR